MEVSANLFKLAAENLLQKSEKVYDKEMKLLKSKNEMLEGEFLSKKRNLEEENESLRSNFEKSRQEKSFLIFLIF